MYGYLCIFEEFAFDSHTTQSDVFIVGSVKKFTVELPNGKGT